jgi:hypothetical protein
MGSLNVVETVISDISYTDVHFIQKHLIVRIDRAYIPLNEDGILPILLFFNSKQNIAESNLVLYFFLILV